MQTWRLLAFDDIDPVRWDGCVQASGTALPYGYHSWLYAAAIDHWCGLVLADEGGEYQAVIPLFKEYKWLVLPYAPMPPFTQKLGLFARPGITIDTKGLAKVIGSYKRWQLAITYAAAEPMLFLLRAKRWKASRNLVLPPTFKAERHARYSKGLRENLKKAVGLEVVHAPGAGNTSRTFNQHVRERAGVPLEHMGRFTRLTLMQNPHYGWLHLVVPNGNQILDPLAGASFVLTKGRMIYLMGASSPLGRERGAMPLILDHALDYAYTNNLTFDFEGGNLAGSGKFFEMFGAVEEGYFVGNWRVGE